jgi:hypothetical protein
MPRANLGQLLGNVEDPVAPAVVAEPPQETAPRVLKVPAARGEKPAPDAQPADEPVAGATYLRFVRKDTRLREDQLESLTSHARRLNRKRRSAGPRVTENTLIRVAVDLLLDRIEKAVGEDEAALLKSVRR